MERKVGIVGAGVSGLLACKYTLSKGFCPIVFETKSQIGGVWTKTLKTTRLQTPKALYQFSDFPWPDSVAHQDFPTQTQVFEYLQDYVNHFGLLKHIKFGCKVVGITFEGASEEEIQSWKLWGGNGEPFSSKGKWKVVVEDMQSLSQEVYQVDFVIICVGQFGDVPKIPEFGPNRGPKAFDGEVIHSLDYSAMDNESAANFVKGKRVTVVGFQKSALDIAMECSMVNGVEYPCTMVYKSKHWNLPDYLPWGVPLAYFFFSRFAELLIHKPGEGFLLSLSASLLSPVRWAFSKFIESHIKRKLPMAKFGMVPDQSILQDLRSCQISSLPDNFYDRVSDGSIVLKKSQSFSFCKEGITVGADVSTTIEADLVILATGFKGEKKLIDIFVSPTFQDCISGSPNSIIPLYRGCIPPRIPQVAVIGFSESVANLYTSEMRCRWLAELLDGAFRLPSIEEMEKDIAIWEEHIKKHSGQNRRRGCFAGLHIWYNDQLCRDMGLNPRRKTGFFAEFFEPYGPIDYA